MSPANEPLFAAERRTSSAHSEEQAAQEDDALLGRQRKAVDRSLSGPSRWRELGLFIWAVVATAAVIVLAVYSQHQHGRKAKPNGKRNLIFMVSDGMGPASLSMTRSFKQYLGSVQFS